MRFDQLSKSLLRDTLAVGGQIHSEHEVPGATQTIDGWFVPDPARRPALDQRGLLGRLSRSIPALLEPFHDPPDIGEVRACIHKQLALDRHRQREAARAQEKRPPFPRLWILSAGRPRRVLKAYGFTPMPGWPLGCWRRSKADALGLIVIRDLPPVRDTLMLRLMGRGAVLRRAVADLGRLPEDAWERQVAMHHLMQFRIVVKDNPTDDEEREYLMSTQSLYESWVQQTRDEGRKEGLKEGHLAMARRSIRTVYEARLGPMPATLVEKLDATEDLARLEAWQAQVAVGSAEEIAAALAPGGERS